MTRIADQLRLLLPPVSYDGNAPELSAPIEAEAAALDALEKAIVTIQQTISPDSGEGLADWERVLALPDTCLIGEAISVGERVAAVVSKLQYRGGQSNSFFISLAQSLGYEITIDIFRPARAGTACAGDPLNGGDWSFTWRVNAPAVTVRSAETGTASAGDPLASWGNTLLECRLSQLKPAESILLFGYGDD